MDCEPDASNMWSEMRQFYKQMTLRLREKQIENEENHFFYSLVIIHDIHLTRYHLTGECYRVKYSVKLLENGLYKNDILISGISRNILCGVCL